MLFLHKEVQNNVLTELLEVLSDTAYLLIGSSGSCRCEGGSSSSKCIACPLPDAGLNLHSLASKQSGSLHA